MSEVLQMVLGFATVGLIAGITRLYYENQKLKSSANVAEVKAKINEVQNEVSNHNIDELARDVNRVTKPGK